MAFTVIKTTWDEDEAALRAIRERVFIREQRVPEALEWDDQDAVSVHFLAKDGHGEAIGCIRLLPSGQMSRLSVLSEHRNQGIGKALLIAAEEEARAQGRDEIFLHAQTHATSFYEAAGFSVTGGIFLEADIPHRQMFKALS
ncbi:GNAT family N-acetyltransferase [Alcanivorax quisquiliarum]|uniref:GNAT family N-acetyltransferase n=1 Tax=Alcanivorax quisquiliarum TaxID=2933565 RepID=A0ABT0E391_9GAMM|nr:GNAT family N-acetyltransferase [Alcanivorax quisquiliarum]MCK0536282.1 GNAT family N-acetyltransferase [Alcanivorax quisquiliarum]